MSEDAVNVVYEAPYFLEDEEQIQRLQEICFLLQCWSICPGEFTGSMSKVDKKDFTLDEIFSHGDIIMLYFKYRMSSVMRRTLSIFRIS
jgi:hypothetical protein